MNAIGRFAGCKSSAIFSAETSGPFRLRLAVRSSKVPCPMKTIQSGSVVSTKIISLMDVVNFSRSFAFGAVSPMYVQSASACLAASCHRVAQVWNVSLYSSVPAAPRMRMSCCFTDSVGGAVGCALAIEHEQTRIAEQVRRPRHRIAVVGHLQSDADFRRFEWMTSFGDSSLGKHVDGGSRLPGLRVEAGASGAMRSKAGASERDMCRRADAHRSQEGMTVMATPFVVAMSSRRPGKQWQREKSSTNARSAKTRFPQAARCSEVKYRQNFPDCSTAPFVH